ncbi:MAG TPA: hypothetical protein VEB21_06040 [Terriglobales bacterium]|nr:hypothetical protein [Terriglobales bacterium]
MSLSHWIVAIGIGLQFGCLSQALAEDVPCPRIIAETNRRITRRAPVDVSEIAKKLKTEIVWVETCLKSYGKRYRRPGMESDGGREAVLDGYEAGLDDRDGEAEEADESDER